LVLALLALGLTFAAPRHTHADASLGWYNAECPLAELAARSEIGGILPSPSTMSVASIAGDTPHVAPQSITSSVVAVAVPRAPPLV